MIRVLHIVGTMDLGGAETLIMNIYRNIDRDKVQFDFLCHNRIEAKYTEEILSMGGRMYCVPGISHVGPFKYQKNLYNFFCEHPEYKTVHSHQHELSGMILAQAKKAAVPNRYSHAHIAFTHRSFIENIQSAVFKSFFPRNITHAFACAIAAGKTLYSGRLRKNFEFLPNGIDTEKFIFTEEKREQFRQQFDFKDKIVIGHIGRFMRQKNHKFLIEVFNEILKNNASAQLVLIGEGALKQEIETQVKAFGIEKNVHFLGARRDIPEFLSAIDLLLFPSLYEGLSVAMIEAQASGVPILTSDTVSSEVAITDRVKQISLELPGEEWATNALDMIAKNAVVDRSIYSQKVKDAGFDAKEIARKLQNFYINHENF